jgi:hypothetical protein
MRVRIHNTATLLVRNIAIFSSFGKYRKILSLRQSQRARNLGENCSDPHQYSSEIPYATLPAIRCSESDDSVRIDLYLLHPDQDSQVRN